MQNKIFVCLSKSPQSNCFSFTRAVKQGSIQKANWGLSDPANTIHLLHIALRQVSLLCMLSDGSTKGGKGVVLEALRDANEVLTHVAHF